MLDIGCGWAYGTHWARTLGCEVSGVDLAHDQLAWARRELPDGARLGLAQANARALPYRDATFDRVVSVETMEHVFRPDRAAVYAELARVLKPGGRLALSTPNEDSPIEAAKRLAVRWPALRRRLPSSCFPEASDDLATYHPYRYHHPLPPAQLIAGLTAAGFEVQGSYALPVGAEDAARRPVRRGPRRRARARGAAAGAAAGRHAAGVGGAAVSAR